MKPFRSLVLMHVPQGTGYAIAPLERLFVDVLADLGQVGPEGVHFAYPQLCEGGDPLRTTKGPVFRFDMARANSSEIAELATYIGREGIEVVLGFDLQAAHSLYPVLRTAGVKSILAYWGAPISSLNRGLRLLAKRLQLLASREKLDGLIFESHAMAKLATHGRGVSPKMVRVVPLGVDTTRFSPGRSSYAHTVLGLAPDQQLIVYSGHMEKRKGVDVLVRAAVRLLVQDGRRDVTFVLFGNRGDDVAELRAIYEGQGVDAHIVFGGYRDDLAAIFPCCAAGVIPSTGWDSFPRTALEFAACGIPLIVSDLGGLPETVVPGKTGLVFPPGDDARLAKDLQMLLDTPLVRDEMGKRGRERCEYGFSLSVQRTALRSAICDLLTHA